jgi:hypothetical protein
MTQIILWLQGKKTYFVAASAILTAFVAYLNNSISLTDFVSAAFAAITSMTLRAAIAKPKV